MIRMSSNENLEHMPSQLELELYFLIANFLSSGPCQRTAAVLKEELTSKKLLPTRTDWQGEEYVTNFEKLIESNRHISPDHILRICQRFLPLLDKEIPPSVHGVVSLLGAGKQYALRTDKDVKNISWSLSTQVATLHQKPLLPPHQLGQAQSIVGILTARQLSGVARKDQCQAPKLYGRVNQLTRSLGHLSAVYCVTFDRTGEYIITGADDTLVKIWSAFTGRLFATLRGHSAEITDMDVNYENTLLATGSCDKNIRIWSLKNTSPVVVLHAHTGSITMLQFCPLVRGDKRYLVSTGGDGCVCFWDWNNKTRKFNTKPQKFIERSRAGTQMLCASFSPGGIFLATGSSDHVVRVFSLASQVPEKICELEAHCDNVDSIQYSHRSSRFITGSKDGTARVWRYDRQQWKAVILDISCTMQSQTIPDLNESTSHNMKVTMVSWSSDDHHVFTAVTDFSIKIWNADTGELMQILKGHLDEAYVLENNPVNSRILLSAGHDGYIIIWDWVAGVILKKHFNSIPGQGHGAVFDCKWSPSGQSFASTDSHGFLMYFGFGENECYQKLPDHQFFHTDYRPLMRDSNNYVLDEQTQQPPHLMPPPFLVDMDGNPHPPHYQRLVPGREHTTDNFLIPMIGVAPSGDREVLDAAIGDVQDEVEVEQPVISEDESQDEPLIVDHMIHRMQQEQDTRIVEQGGEPIQGQHADGPLSPPPSRSSRRSIEEGNRRVSITNQSSHDGEAGPSSSHQGEGVDAEAGQSLQPPSMSIWNRHTCVRPLARSIVRHNEKWRLSMAEAEVKLFTIELKKKPLPLSGNDSSDSVSYIKTRKKRKGGGRGGHHYTTEETGVNRLVTRALYDTEQEEEEENISEQELDEDDQIWHSDPTSNSESSDYSDWTPDATQNLQPPKRQSQRQPKKKKFTSSEEESSEDERISKRSVEKKKKAQPIVKRKESRRQRQQRKVMRQKSSLTECPEEFRPPDWLCNTVPRRAPYIPQMGDEVVYFRQGHQLYLQAVKNRDAYDIAPNKNQPWHKLQLRELEMVKVVGIKYEIRPPRLVCLKLALIDADSGRLLGGTFTIKYHDMPDVIDFLVLRQDFAKAMARKWKVGDRFRSMIDDAWWTGRIVSQEPLHEEFQDSPFQCFNVDWDNGEREKMSPWDLERIDRDRSSTSQVGGVSVTPGELKKILYSPKKREWPPCGRDEECDRISSAFEHIMELSIAEHFLAPVDLNAFPVYAMVIEYPIDLSTIKDRLNNRFYRRITALQYDVRCIETNTKHFNEASSQIVKTARLLTELCLRIISDPECTDPMPVYSKLAKDADFALGPRRGATSDSSYDGDTDDAGEGTSSRKSISSRRCSKAYSWRGKVNDLWEELMECEDSEPFRQGVDPMELPDYYQIIDNTMDLAIVKERIDADGYENPQEFCDDIRLLVSNSKQYNTNKKSRIYSMTLRLSAKFEDRFRILMTDYKKMGKSGKGKTQALRSRKVKPAAAVSSSSSRFNTSFSPPATSYNARPITRTTTGRLAPRHHQLDSSSGNNSNSSSGSSSSSSESENQVAEDNKRTLNRPGRITRNRAVKRKRPDSSSDDHKQQNGNMGSPSEDNSSDSDFVIINKKAASKKTKNKGKSKKKKTIYNGDNNKRYKSRSSTGRAKKQRFITETSESEIDASNNDSTSATSEDSYIEDNTPSTRSTKNRHIDSDTESYSDDDIPVIKSRSTSSKLNCKQYNNKQSVKHLSSSKESRRSKNGRMSTRNQGRRTVQYDEDSDAEVNVSNCLSSSDENEKNTSVSSRGRVRKLTARARALVGD